MDMDMDLVIMDMDMVMEAMDITATMARGRLLFLTPKLVSLLQMTEMLKV